MFPVYPFQNRKGQLSPTYEKIMSLARGLDVPIAALFHEESAHTPNGRLAVTRAGSARTHSTKQYDYQALCADLSNKRFVPRLTRIKARSLREFPALLQHEGESLFMCWPAKSPYTLIFTNRSCSTAAMPAISTAPWGTPAWPVKKMRSVVGVVPFHAKHLRF